MKTFLLIPLILLINLAAFAQTNTIPFELMGSGHMLVKAKVEGVEGSFIFDTGAGITMFTKIFFNKLKTTSAEDGTYTGFRATGERLDINLYHVKDFEFGSLKKAKEEVSWLDINLGGIDGIISLKLLENHPFSIDFKKKVIILESKQSLDAIKKTAKLLPIQLEQSREKALTIFAYFKVNDSLTLQLSMDSGAGKEVYRLNSKYLKPLHVDINDSLKVTKKEKRSEINEAFVSTIYSTKLAQLAAANDPTIKVLNFPAQFVDGLIYDGIIWINWLGSKISFDLQHKSLFVQQ